MKLYKSLLFGLLVCGMAACDTTDLERDINSLKDRVEDYEAQVQKLNDDMNIIRVLLDGNKTITSYSFDGANYTLTLSNGETLTLTQGVVGANYPSITIGENGNWVIAGTDSGIRAEAKDGEDAPYTPQFKIENENWCVSLDGGATWQNLGVKATGTASGTSPISGVAASDNSITITLSDGTPYTIPVVKDLVCEITDPALADGEMWYIGCRATEKLKVKVNIQAGDIIRPVVPADWTANIVTPNYTSLSGEQTLDVEVTAPATASKCVVTMEVNRGANTVTDEIVARTKTTSYYADFMAGMDIQVGSVTLNKYMFEESEIHAPSESETTLTAAGIYFLNSEATVSLSANLTNVNKLVVIGNTPSASLEQMPTIKYTGNFYMSLGGNTGGLGLLLKNVKIDASSSTTYSFNIGSAFVDANTYFENLVFDRCNILFSSGNSFVYVNNSAKKMPIQNIEICNTLLSSESAAQKYVFSFSNHEYEGFKNFTVENSVFYCRTENAAITNFSLMQCANEKGIGFENIKVKNNTFVNVIPANQLVKVKMFNVDFSNNLLWRNTDKGGYLLYGIKGSVFGTASFADNMYYNADAGTVSFNLFNTDGVVPDNVTNSLQKLSSDPFETLNVTNAQFDLLPAYQNVGAHLE